MIRITQLAVLVDKESELEFKVIKILKTEKENIKSIKIAKKSIDARDKSAIKFVFTVDVTLFNENKIQKKVFNKDIFKYQKEEYSFPSPGDIPLRNRPVIVGMGPAGLFCAYFLALKGYKPILIERGEDALSRAKTVEKYFKENILNKESNIQFGEGGAGTFSDGKLNTLVKDKSGKNTLVLETFHKFGASEEITYTNKPHIGTDVLINIVINMRNEIIKLGGEVHFSSKLTDIFIKDDKVEGILINDTLRIDTDCLVLALGHSARDSFYKLYDKGIYMEPKAFAVGLRIEHPQYMINENMYGVSKHEILENADYKVTHKGSDGRGVYSFCMCPGGYVVNASSEEESLCVNGMSYSDRSSPNANSAIIVTVTPEDYNANNALSGIEFQRKLEKAAFIEGEGLIPIQLFKDFKNNVKSSEFGEIKPCLKGAYNFSNLRNIFPEFINNSLIEGIDGFNRSIKGFNREDALLSGVDSRTSSPLRILRNEDLEANIKGIYPCGEGAGYAGGITSAAMDGIRVFEKIVSKYNNGFF